MVLRSKDPKYHRQKLVETKFSVLKRKFGSDLKVRMFLIWIKEIASKMIVCNLHRFLPFVIANVF